MGAYSSFSLGFGIATLILFVLFFGGSTLLAIRRRSYFPLNGRCLPLVYIPIFGSLTVLFNSSVREIVGRESYPCALYLWCGNLFIPLVFGPIIIRVIRLARILHFNKEKLAFSVRHLDSNKMDELKKLKTKSSQVSIGILYTAFFAPHFVFMSVIPAIISDDVNAENLSAACSISAKGNFVFLSFSALYLVICIGCVQYLQSMPDEFEIRTEFYHLMLGWLIFGVLYACGNFIPALREIHDEKNISLSYILWCGMIMNQIISVVIPLHKTYIQDTHSNQKSMLIRDLREHLAALGNSGRRQSRMAQSPKLNRKLPNDSNEEGKLEVITEKDEIIPTSSINDANTQEAQAKDEKRPDEEFFNLLNDPNGLNAFEQYLVREFNAENIKFWREVNAYHDLVDECGFDEEQSPSPDKVKQVMELAKQLYDTFISDEAPLQVNLPHKTKTQIEEDFSKKRGDGLPDVSGNVFDRAQDDIYLLMLTDPFTRFKRSEMFSAYLREKEGTRQVPAQPRTKWCPPFSRPEPMLVSEMHTIENPMQSLHK